MMVYTYGCGDERKGVTRGMLRSGSPVTGCGPTRGLALLGPTLLLVLAQSAGAVTRISPLIPAGSVAPTAGPLGYVAVAGPVRITDNDVTHSLAINNATVAEGGGAATLRVTFTDNDGPTVTPPSAPRTLAADPGDQQVTLSWTLPASSGGGTITRYEYRRAEISDTLPNNWTTVAGGAGAREVTVGSLTNGTTYRFQVRAVNEAGGGNPATTTAAPADPSASPALSVPDLTVGEGDGTAVVRVALAPAASQTVTVSYETSDGTATAGDDYTAANGTLTFTAGTTAREIRVTITNDTEEEDEESFAITLSDAQGADIGRATGEVTIQDNDAEAEAPSRPQNLAALAGDEEITLIWRPPASDGGKPIVRYEYRFAEGSGSFPESWTVVSGGPGARRVEIEGLKNGVAYRFQVHAVNEAGAGNPAQEEATPKDTGPPPSLWIDDVSVGEGSATAVLRVTLSEASSSEVTVKYATRDGSATEGEDYTATDSTLTFAPDVTALEISIPITEDTDEEGNENFTVRLSDAEGAEIGDGTGQVTILDNDGDATAEAPGAPRDLRAVAGDGEVTLSWAVPASDGGAPITRYEYRYSESTEPYSDTWTTVAGGSGARQVTVDDLDNGTQYDFEARAVNEVGEGEAVQASATPSEASAEPALTIEDETVDEDDGVAVVRVRLSPASEKVVTVRYETQDLGATAGEDYSGASGTLSFNPRDTQQEIRVPIINDDDDEASERFEIELSAAVNATIEVRTAEVTIRDDDSTEKGETPGVPRNLLAIGENRRVELNWSQPESDGGVAISHYEYRFVEGSNRFPVVWTPIDGGGDVRRLRVTQLSNGVTYRFEVRAVNGVGPGPPALTEGTPVHPDSTPTIRIRDADVGEEDGEVTLTVIMTPASSETVNVAYATANGTATAGEDYADTTGTLTFRLRSTRQTITVRVLDDEEEEGDETFSVTLSLVGDPDVEIAEGTATVTIRDNEGDTAATAPGRPRALFGEGEDSLVTLTWRAPESDGGAPITHYEYQYAEDGDAFRGRWRGIIGEGRARKFTVDGLTNGTRYRFQVRAVNRVGPGQPAETVATPGETGTRPSVSVSPQELEIGEGDSASYTIVLDSEPTAGVTVRMTADLSETDLEVEPAEVVFTTSNWNEPRTVKVRSEADDDEEDDLGIALTHEASGGGYDDIEVAAVTVDILEFKPAPVPEILGSSARATERAGGELIFFLSLTKSTRNVVSVDYETTDGTAVAGKDYEEHSGTVIFLPGTIVQGIAVPLLNDSKPEEDETLILELFNPVNGTLKRGVERLLLGGTIIDDDEGVKVSFGEAAYEVDEGGSVSIAVELSADPDREIRIPIAVTRGEGVEEDEISIAGHVTFADGQTRAEVEFGTSGDHVDEDDEVVVLRLGPTLPEDILAGDLMVTEVRIIDDDEGVRVSFGEAAYEVDEGGSVSIAVELSADPDREIRIPIAVTRGEGVEEDEISIAGHVTFADGQTRAEVEFGTSGDHVDEDDEVVVLRLGPTLPEDILAGDLMVTEVRIIDDDEGVRVSFGEAAYEVDEGGSVSIAVELSADPDREIRIPIAVTRGEGVEEDEISIAGHVTFADGQTRAEVEFGTSGDHVDEDDEVVVLRLGPTLPEDILAGDLMVTEVRIIDDDEGVRVSFGEAAYEVDEGGSVSIAVELSADPDREIRIPIAVTRGEGVEEDEISIAGHVTFADGQTRAEVEFGTSGDHVDEDDEVVVLRLGPTLPEDILAGDLMVTEVRIIDDDARGVRLSPATLEVTEGDSASYTAQLTSQPAGDVTVRMTADLEETSLTVEPVEVVFTPASWSEPQVIAVRSALDLDQDDELGISLTHEASGGGYGGVEAPTVTVDVIDLKLPTLQGDDVRAEEAEGVVRFGVRLSSASRTPVTIEYATADGTAAAAQDYQAGTGTLTFRPGTILQVIAVPVLDDYRDEEDETFRLELFNPVGATLGEAGDRLVLTGTIADDDETVEVSFEAGAYEVDEGGSATLSVEISGDPGRAIRIPIAVTRGQNVEDGEFAVAESVLFNHGQTSATVDFRSTEDDVDEDDEVVVLGLGPSLPEGLVAGDPAGTEVTILDDDERGVEISATALEVDEGTSATYTVGLTSRPTATVTVVVEGDLAGSDVTVNPSRLSFAPQAWRNAKTVTVSAAHDRDAIDEPGITLSHRVTGGDYTGVTAADVTVTVIEDDTPVLTVPDAEAVEGDGEMVFEATLDIRSSREVRVNYVSVGETATEDVDYTRQQGTLVFAPLQTSTRFVVPLVDDDIDEPAEHFRVEFSGYVNASSGEDPQPVTGTILDDDLPVLAISAVDGTVAEGTDARFRLVREGDLTVTLSVPVTVVETGDFLTGPAPGTFDFAVGAAEAILALPTENDALDERDGTIEATIAASDDYEISGSPTAQVAVTDNDATPAVIVAGAEVPESAEEIAFPVTLRGASAYEVRVDWITGDETARAGEDYEAATGRVTFAPGETVGEIRVTVLDDLLPEGSERFTVTLSGATNAMLDVVTATGTITDDDEVVVPAWLSRFGRTVASQVVEGVSERVMSGGGGRSQLNTSRAAAAADGEGRRLGVGDLLDGSTFYLGGGGRGQEASGSGGGWTAWGRGTRTSFGGVEEGLSVDGTVLTALAGVDYEAGPVLAGIAASYSLGEGTLARSAGGSSQELSQDIESTLSSVYPYLRVTFTDRLSAWGLGGYGLGDMSFPGAEMAGETGIRMRMGALGARGALLNPEGAGISLALKSDAFLVRMSTDADAGTTSVEADASRVRFLLEAASRLQVGASGLFAPTVEVGVRMDDGDAETGTGLEVGGGLKYTNEAYGLSIEGTARMLMSHQDTAFSEWGVGGALLFQPGGPQQGLSVRMGTSWGATAGSAEDLWSPNAVGGVGTRGPRVAGSGGRFMAQLHYAMSPFGEGLSMAPYAEFGLGGGARVRTSRVGWRFDVLESLRLGLETDLAPDDSAQGAGGLGLRASLRR